MPQNVQSIQYAFRFTKLAEYRNNVWKILVRNFFQKYVPIDATILDVGAGWGEFVNNVQAKRKYAMDMNPDTKNRLSQDIVFMQQNCAAQWKFPDNELDVVFTSNFIEHLESKRDIEKMLDEAHRCLKTGGVIICLGPNIKHVRGAYWDFWDHYIPITESSLSEVLNLKGFTIEKCVDRFLPYSMSQGWRPPQSFISLYLKLPVLWRFFGKQFLIVAKKS